MSGRRGWGLQSLERLKTLKIYSGTDEEEESSFPEEWLLPRSLTHLTFGNQQNLKRLNYRGLQHLTSLETLEIWDCPKLQSLPKEGLPASLETLSIEYCPKLQSLPKEGLPSSLLKLKITGCPRLTPLLEREKGKDWPKVAHIPAILVHGELFP